MSENVYKYVHIFPANPLATLIGLLLCGVLLQRLFPNAAKSLVEALATPRALKISLLIALALSTVAGTGFFHAVAAAATRGENEAGSWFEGVNTVIGGCGLIVQSVLTYALYRLTEEQTKYAAAQNALAFTDTILNFALHDGVLDPRDGIQSGIRAKLFNTINGIGPRSTRELLGIFYSLKENRLTSPLVFSGRANSVIIGGDDKPKACRIASRSNSRIVQMVNLGDDDLVAILRGRNLDYQVLTGFDFYGARLCDFSMRGANLRGACLINATFTDVDLRGADLSGAMLTVSDAERQLLTEYKLDELSADEQQFRLRGNCRLEGMIVDRSLYEYLQRFFGDRAETKLAGVIVNEG